jgi:hypothetical protein
MMLLAALLVMQATPWVYVDPAASKAAAQIFRDACTKGEVNVTPENGHRLSDRDAVDYAHVLGWRATKHSTVVEFTNPRATYLVFADYEGNQPGSIGRECVVVSRVLSLEDALAAMMSTAPEIEPRRAWIPNMYLNGWTVDARKRGFRSSVSVRGDRSVQIDLGTYASAMDKQTSESGKQ